jgi:hypothetical protein
MSASVGNALKNLLNASSPPADAPIPTTGNPALAAAESARFELDGVEFDDVDGFVFALVGFVSDFDGLVVLPRLVFFFAAMQRAGRVPEVRPGGFARSKLVHLIR